MKNDIDVTALGELLIDFTENGLSNQKNSLFEANPGGAPCNVLAMLTKLGKNTAFIGKVGDDFFGASLKKELESIGINTKNLLKDKAAPTTLAFVHNYAGGDREFSFYRNPGADMLLKKEEICTEMIAISRIFHFGTLSFTGNDSKEATCFAVECAKKKNKIISFDPNVRKALWNSDNEIKQAMDYGMKHCDILKISDDEILFHTGMSNYDKAVEKIQSKYEIPLICVTLGKEGSLAYYGSIRSFAEPYIQTGTMETTGAGDTFMGCILNYVLENGLKGLDKSQLHNMLNFANAAASIITTRRGALKVMPEQSEIEELVYKKVP